ncbi:MAG TPA: putative oxidoreductase C-terminal domain-containing protein [Candidatus Acidoferrales bacterium]|jgi:predicted dehydrogenase|nr:putative oxidoreductase C-terminal domain-containing protein [Candidatus Acidoferrales bacterium]
MDEFRLIILDPGHFHAALIQKSMYAGVSKRVAVYAPLGPDLIAHLDRIARFNLRSENPTGWELNVQTAPYFLERMVADRPGNIVVLSGRNRAKIGRIRASLDVGLHVLADKPWIIRPEDLPELAAALPAAARQGLIAYDIMTERFEITSILQRELVNDAEVFGTILPGSPEEPSVYMESVHHILKLVAGVPNLRPVWFFDIAEQGEALADVGTHLVDLVQWTLFPEIAIDYRSEIRMLAAARWPTSMTAEQFRQVTGVPGEGLDYYCNTSVTYALRGVHTRLDVLWRWEAASGPVKEGGGDTHYAVFRGSKSRVEVRQGKEENYRPELYVVPDHRCVVYALRGKIGALAKQYPGVGLDERLDERGGQIRVTIPDRYRVGHEAHFAQVTNQFFEYLKRPETLPVWENPNMIAKYYVSTKGVELSRAGR